jgi:hypothetical protein
MPLKTTPSTSNVELVDIWTCSCGVPASERMAWAESKLIPAASAHHLQTCRCKGMYTFAMCGDALSTWSSSKCKSSSRFSAASTSAGFWSDKESSTSLDAWLRFADTPLLPLPPRRRAAGCLPWDNKELTAHQRSAA